MGTRRESKEKNKKKNRISKMCMNKKKNVKLANCKGAGCIACDSPFYPDCIDSCPMFDD